MHQGVGECRVDRCLLMRVFMQVAARERRLPDVCEPYVHSPAALEGGQNNTGSPLA